MDLVSLVLARYKVVAKEQVKLELEALADKLTSKDLYVVFTKTKELKYDETFSIDSVCVSAVSDGGRFGSFRRRRKRGGCRGGGAGRQ